MKRGPTRAFMWVLIVLMCFFVVSMPIMATGRASDSPDAVSGSRGAIHTMAVTRRSTHEVFISAGIGGSAASSVSSCSAGTVVTVTLAPEPGYDPASVVAITSAGNELQVTYAEGVFSFVMPASSVVVDVSFQLTRV